MSEKERVELQQEVWDAEQNYCDACAEYDEVERLYYVGEADDSDKRSALEIKELTYAQLVKVRNLVK